MTSPIEQSENHPPTGRAAAADFARDGFAVLPSLVDSLELDRLRAELEALYSRAGPLGGDLFDMLGRAVGRPDRLMQLMYPSRHSPALASMPVLERARAWAATLLGGSVSLYFDNAILKPARFGPATPWHQDEAYWDPAWCYASVTIWVPMQDVDETNGCMHFSPGSHRRPVAAHRAAEGGAHALELVRKPRKAVACPIPAGWATAHHQRTAHSAGPNRSPEPRLAYILVFSRPRVPVGRPVRRPWREALVGKARSATDAGA